MPETKKLNKHALKQFWSKIVDLFATKKEIETLNNNLTESILKAIDSVNAKDFGCKGDGETDDTVALQEAIVHAEDNGLPLFLPRGTYVFTDRLFIRKPVTIMGSSLETTTLWFKGGREQVTTTHFGTEQWEEASVRYKVPANTSKTMIKFGPKNNGVVYMAILSISSTEDAEKNNVYMRKSEEVKIVVYDINGNSIGTVTLD